MLSSTVNPSVCMGLLISYTRNSSEDSESLVEFNTPISSNSRFLHVSGQPIDIHSHQTTPCDLPAGFSASHTTFHAKLKFEALSKWKFSERMCHPPKKNDVCIEFLNIQSFTTHFGILPPLTRQLLVPRFVAMLWSFLPS